MQFLRVMPLWPAPVTCTSQGQVEPSGENLGPHKPAVESLAQLFMCQNFRADHARTPCHRRGLDLTCMTIQVYVDGSGEAAALVSRSSHPRSPQPTRLILGRMEISGLQWMAACQSQRLSLNNRILYQPFIVLGPGHSSQLPLMKKIVIHTPARSGRAQRKASIRIHAP